MAGSRNMPPSSKHIPGHAPASSQGASFHAGVSSPGTGASRLFGGGPDPVNVQKGTAAVRRKAAKTAQSSSQGRNVRPFPLPPEDELSAEQTAVIELPFFKDYLIEGQEGSGKTVSAMYRAMKISEKSRELIYLLVPEHKDMLALRASVRGRHEFDGVVIDTFTSWLRDFYKLVLKKKVPKPDSFQQPSRSDTDWGQVVRDSYAGVDTYKHIIIDEAQDFPPELLKAIGMAACYVTCFIDPDKAAKDGSTSVTDACAKLLIESPRTLRGDFRYAPYGTAGKTFPGAAGTVPGEREIIDLLEGAVSEGLSLRTNRQLYLLVADLLAKLYIRDKDYNAAINYLMDIDDSSPDVPDSIHLSYLYAQIMTENILRFAAEPVLLFRRLDRISAASFTERAEFYKVFLKRLAEVAAREPSAGQNLEKFRKQAEKYTGLPAGRGNRPGIPAAGAKGAPAAEPASGSSFAGPDSGIFDENDGIRLKNALGADRSPDALSDKKRLKGLISDYYFDDPLKKNIYRAIIEDDLALEISEQTKIDATRLMRYVMKLSGSRGIDRRLSEAAILSWCEALSVDIVR